MEYEFSPPDFVRRGHPARGTWQAGWFIPMGGWFPFHPESKFANPTQSPYF